MRYSHDSFARSSDSGATFRCAIYEDRRLLAFISSADRSRSLYLAGRVVAALNAKPPKRMPSSSSER